MSVRFDKWWNEVDEEVVEALMEMSIWGKRVVPVIARDHVMLTRLIPVAYCTFLSLAMACS